jgi:phage FluMu gp28-like protein
MPRQKKWVFSESPMKIWEKSRQVGATWSEAFWTVKRRCEKKVDHYFISADEATAKNFINDCRHWVDVFNHAAEYCGLSTEDSPFIALDPKKQTQSTMVFPNGASVIALSSSPKAIRGKRGDVTLDEFAFHEFSLEMYAAAQPATRWAGDGAKSGHLHLISTHNGPGTLYYRICRDAEKKKRGNQFELHHLDIEEAVADGLAEKVGGEHRSLPTREARGRAFIENVKASCVSEDMFLQEYMCQPLSASTLVKPAEYDRVLEIIKDKPWGVVADTFDPNEHYGQLFVGVDVGRAVAKTVITVLEQGTDNEAPASLQNVYRQVCVIVLDGQEINAQYATLKPILAHRSLALCRIDMGAIGRALSDLAVADFGGIVEPVAFTSNEKAQAAELVKFFIQSARVTVPSNPILREDILCMRRQVNMKGGISYEGNSSLGHADYFWSLSQALRAGEQNNPLSVQLVEYDALAARQLALPAA